MDIDAWDLNQLGLDSQQIVKSMIYLNKQETSDQAIWKLLFCFFLHVNNTQKKVFINILKSGPNNVVSSLSFLP